MYARSKRSRSLRSVMTDVARTFDFNMALSRRTVTRSAEEDMALAWREVYGGLPLLSRHVPAPDQQSLTEDSSFPPTAPLSPDSGDEGAAALATPVLPQEPGEQPPQTVRSSHGAIPDGQTQIGYRGPTACRAAGITYRQLDYWARTGLVVPSVRAAHGSGAQRLYGFRDILVLKIVKRLLDTGISLQEIRVALRHLRDRNTEDLAEVTLMSDGKSVYEVMSPDEVVDLLAGDQAVFGIALGRVWQEVAGELIEMPAVRATDGLPTVGAEDPVISSAGSGAQNGIEQAG